MTTSSPLATTTSNNSSSSSSSSKPHLSSLSLGPTPKPPPSLASPSPSNHSRRITSWGSVNSDSGFSVTALGERGMTPLPSPMENREWGFLPPSGDSSNRVQSWQNNNGGMSSWGKKSQRWNSGEFTTTESGKSWMSNFQPPTTPSSPTTFTSSSQQPPIVSPSPTTTTKEPPAVPLPTRSKTLSFFDSSSSPVIAPSTSSTSLGGGGGGGSDPSFLLLSPPPNPPSRNNSLSAKYRPNRPNRPRSSSRLSISDLPDQQYEHDPSSLRSSTNSTTSTSWLEDTTTSRGGGGEGGKRNRVSSVGSWSSEVIGNNMRTRTETGSSSSNGFGGVENVTRRLFMDLDSSTTWSGTGTGTGTELETVKNSSPDRPKLTQLDTSNEVTNSSSGRERSISTNSTGEVITKPLSSLPTAGIVVETPMNQHHRTVTGGARFLNQSRSQSQGGNLKNSSSSSLSPSYKNSPPPSIDLSQLKSNRSSALLLAPSTREEGGRGGSITPRTPPSMEELQKIIGETTISSSISNSSTSSSQNIEKGDLVGDYKVIRMLGKGAFSRVALASKEETGGKGGGGGGTGEEVALKLMERKSCETNERMRISVLREVEVLKTISHPSLVTLSHSFSTPMYTVLVLDFCKGGELFDFLQESYSQITEGLARRIVSELSDAVSWLHSVGLVHRDIKLENILLTSRLFPLPDLNGNPLDYLSGDEPFVKLTDFGLSRFINPLSPLLQTRCGSEAYAAPELLMGKPYDGFLTDSWAVGIVFYAVVTGGLPFVEQVETSREKFEGLERRISTRGGRKGYLLKIAKAEYEWPADKIRGGGGKIEFSKELKEIVGKLLVRDPGKRLRVGSESFWECDWISGDGREGRIERRRGKITTT